jgi:hypothetical protein
VHEDVLVEIFGTYEAVSSEAKPSLHCTFHDLFTSLVAIEAKYKDRKTKKEALPTF